MQLPVGHPAGIPPVLGARPRRLDDAAPRAAAPDSYPRRTASDPLPGRRAAGFPPMNLAPEPPAQASDRRASIKPVLPWELSLPVPSLPFRLGPLDPVSAEPLPGPEPPPLDMAPEAKAEAPPERIYPVADFVALEYYSQRVRGAARIELRPAPAPRLPVQLPAMRIAPLGALPKDLAPPRPAKKPKAKIVSMPAGAKPAGQSRMWWRAAGAIAAGVFIGLFVWGSASMVRIGLKSGPAAADGSAAGASLHSEGGSAPAIAPSLSGGELAPAPAAHGPVAWVRNAVVKRATVEFNDTFRHGMSAWGERGAALAPGWSKNPEGYVRPGQLALFRPSLAYSNYHMEFFAQIESKSVGWVVRARDRKNYYAMKFKVVEPGLRPIIAMVHVTVRGGKPGREVEIPLSVMVHNNEAYHVAVEVKGNRVVTSIEGQEIDSFTDNTLPSGGVGFFADAGEKARLYWMRVTANDDFVGRVCAYVAGALGKPSPTVAGWRPGEAPAGAPGPWEPRGEIALGAALGFWKNRKREAWN